MPALRKIVATRNTDSPTYQRNMVRPVSAPADLRPARHRLEGRARRSRARRLRCSARAARGRGRPRRSRRAARAPDACSGLRCGCLTFQRPASCSITSFESPRTRTRRDGARRGRLEPGDQRRGTRRRCWWSPRCDSLTVASATVGALDGSSTTAPIAAGPGFPRAPPSKNTVTSSRRSEAPPSGLTGPGCSRSCRSARSIPSADFWMLLRPRWPGSRGGNPGRCCRRAGPPRRRAPSPGGARSRPPARDRAIPRSRPARRASSRHLAVDRLPRPPRACGGAVCSSAVSVRCCALEVGELRVERLALLHELELAVLDVALVPLQLVDVGLHRLELARRG